jgi:hypothetical protein
LSAKLNSSIKERHWILILREDLWTFLLYNYQTGSHKRGGQT